ncbi:MAG: trypsin-like peptidase domain-containing protein [Burkholderiales bacterium]|nr:trypsin-like peptidase domain-containing protein [Burkholderiales bacterium]
MTWRSTWLLFAQTVTVALALLFVVATLQPEWLRRDGAGALPAPTFVRAPPPAASTSAGTAGNAAAGLSYATAVQRAAPAVVSITATRVERNPHADDPHSRFFFGERAPAPRRQIGLGSGVIVAPEGYLLTNHHVVDGAVEIEVQLADGRQTQARLVGSDAETDIAVLKVDLRPLPVLAMSDGARLQVGDAVLAIGNPFNIGQTVTAGIVSALDRTQRGSSPFQNFIQTDAAINPGNSGGALVDAAGTLVGINTAIFSRDGGNLGIGFAVPTDTARDVMQAIVRGGKVQRGWIGVDPRDLSAELAESLALSVQSGVLVAGVMHDGPAAAGGVRPGDVLLSVAGRKVASSAELLPAVAALPPGSKARVVVQRGTQSLELDLTIGERPPVGRP